jgi:VanZ family protein
MHVPEKADVSSLHRQAERRLRSRKEYVIGIPTLQSTEQNGKAVADTVNILSGQGMRAWILVAAYMALIFYLSSLPHPDEELPKFLFEKLSDKLLHAIEYAVLAVLCYRAFRRAAGPFAAGYAVILAIITASFYGATDEVHQAFVPLRTSSWTDWVADTVGGVIGAVGAQRLIEHGMKKGIS